MNVNSTVELLNDFEIFRTRNLLEAQQGAELVTAPHRLRLHGRPEDFQASAHSASVGPVTLFVVRYGAEVTLDRPGCDDYVSVLVPLGGRLIVKQREREFIARPNESMAILSPGQGSVQLNCSAGTAVLSLKAHADELGRALRWIAPQADRQQFVAASPLLTGPAQRAILGVSQLFSDVFSSFGPNRCVSPPLAKQLREQTLSTFWLSIPNNHTDTIYGTRNNHAGTRLREVLDLIAAESRAEYTVPDLARAMNVGVRALELAFRRELDQTPLRYLNYSRMERAHEELRDADPSHVTVTQVATKWGFGHLGRFAARYRARYGESPSKTLHSYRPSYSTSETARSSVPQRIAAV